MIYTKSHFLRKTPQKKNIKKINEKQLFFANIDAILTLEVLVE